jgi:hypothetical protein
LGCTLLTVFDLASHLSSSNLRGRAEDERRRAAQLPTVIDLESLTEWRRARLHAHAKPVPEILARLPAGAREQLLVQPSLEARMGSEHKLTVDRG